jgi:uncharacterized protein with NAD-binding domain and iron-sulfur cluster
MTAAFELTRPELGGRYEVTVYQMGFRLGGKGASGRGEHGRVEEHGLHLWMGYYENAFRLMRDCYAERSELDPSRGAMSFEEAFSPAHFNGAMDRTGSGEWLPWKVEFPPMPGLPGDPNPPKNDILTYLIHAARLLRTLLTTLSAERSDETKFDPVAPNAEPSEAELLQALKRLTKLGAFAGLGAAVEAVRWLELVLSSLPQYPQSLVARLLDAVSELAGTELRRLTETNHELRRLWEVAELILATIRGCIRFRLVFDPRGFDAIDDYDCRAWLKLNGASEGAINSAFIRALYDLAFAYEDGDERRPAIAAGSALRGAFRAFFSYRGAFFWRMNAGMGDVVFAPLYQVLRRRGVRFEFFHKLTNLGLSAPGADSPHVESLEFDVQARTLSGGEYEPLCWVKDLPCWPAGPAFAQLVGGAELEALGVDFETQSDRRACDRKSLRVGADFDFVVLAVGLGVVRSVCGSILERDQRYRDMVERVKSVPTQAFQLWLDKDLWELGGGSRPINLSGYVEPFDTLADMTHLIPREDWAKPPKLLAYFCNVLRDTAEPQDRHYDSAEFLARERLRVRQHCIDFLNRDASVLWPRAATQGGFDWSALSSDAELQGSSRFSSQYWTANVRPSDRYSQALPGTTRFRISPLDRSYDNLTLAGDWTNCSLNMGCVEAAVMSGMLAAHALSGSPALERIVGYDHP